MELVETTSPSSHSNLKLVEALSPSYCSSIELVEILSPSHYAILGLKEVLFPSLKIIATRHQQSSSRSARPDLILEVGLEPPAAAPASRAPHECQQIAVEPASRIPLEELPPTIIIVKERVERINV